MRQEKDDHGSMFLRAYDDLRTFARKLSDTKNQDSDAASRRTCGTETSTRAKGQFGVKLNDQNNYVAVLSTTLPKIWIH